MLDWYRMIQPWIGWSADERLTWIGYTKPCVLDLKMGTRMYGDFATETKRRSQVGRPLMWWNNGLCINSQAVLWIRIRTRIGSGFNGFVDPYPDSQSWWIQEGKMTHKHRKKLINFIFWSAGCSLLRADDFSCSLDISKLEFLIKKRYKKVCSSKWIGSGFT